MKAKNQKLESTRAPLINPSVYIYSDLARIFELLIGRSPPRVLLSRLILDSDQNYPPPKANSQVNFGSNASKLLPDLISKIRIFC